MQHLDDHGKNSANYRKRKWLLGGSAIGITGVILIVYMSTTNLGSTPASVSSTYLSNTQINTWSISRIVRSTI